MRGAAQLAIVLWLADLSTPADGAPLNSGSSPLLNALSNAGPSLTATFNKLLGPVGEVLADTTGSQQGCLSFVGWILQGMWRDCQQRAKTQTWQTWTYQIQQGVLGGKIDPLWASQETCRLVAEQQTCEKLGQQLSFCNVLGMIQTSAESAREKQRCDSVTTVIFNPISAPSGVNNLITNEILGGIVQNLLSGK